MSNCCNRLLVEVKQGEARSFGFTVTSSQGTLEQPLDLTGCTISMEIRKTPYVSVETILTKQITSTPSDDGYIQSPTTGEFQFNISEEETSTIPPNDYYLSMYVKRPDGSIFCISAEGNNSGIFRFCKC